MKMQDRLNIQDRISATNTQYKTDRPSAQQETLGAFHLPCSPSRDTNRLYEGENKLGAKDEEKGHKIKGAVRPVK